MKTQAMKRAVVTGRNYCNILTMARDLGEAGYDVAVLRVFKKKPSAVNLLSRMKPDAYSRYVTNYQECIVNGKPEVMVNALKELSVSGQQTLLMPVDDYTACIVDEYLEELKKYFVIPNISETAGEISRLMDKNEQKKLAGEFGLPILHSTLISSVDGRFEIPEDVSYPCFVKPNISMKSSKSRMVKCEDRESLKKVLSRYAKAEDFEMLVEAFADIKAEYSVLGLSTKEVTKAFGLLKAIEGGHKERKGVTLIGEMMPCNQFEELIAQCDAFINSLNYTGLYDVDLIETKDGKVYFVELNFRAGASTHALTRMGSNIPGMFADYIMEGTAVDVDKKIQDVRKRFISEKILIEEFTRSDASAGKVRRCMKEADICFIKDKTDMRPYRHFRRYYIAAALLRIPYRLREQLRK